MVSCTCKFSVLGSSLPGFIVIIYITNLKYTVRLYMVNEHVIYVDLFDISHAKHHTFLKLNVQVLF